MYIVGWWYLVHSFGVIKIWISDSRRNQLIHSGHGFIRSFDAARSEWSCSDYPKGMHSLFEGAGCKTMLSDDFAWKCFFSQSMWIFARGQCNRKTWSSIFFSEVCFVFKVSGEKQNSIILLLLQCATGKMFISLIIQQNVNFTKNKQTTKLYSLFNNLMSNVLAQ